MNLTAEDVNKMKVVELRAELQVRGLDPKGVKAVLVDRLIAALGQEGGTVSAVGNGSSAVSLDLSSGDLDESKCEDDGEGTPADETPSKVEDTQPEAEADTSEAQENQNEDQAEAAASQSNEVDEEENEEGDTAVVADVDNGNEDAPEGEGDEAPADTEMAEAEPEAEVEAEAEVKSEDVVKPAEEEEKEKEKQNMETDQEGDTSKRKIETVNGEAADESKAKKQKTEEAIVFKNVPLNEPEFDENTVILDWCMFLLFLLNQFLDSKLQNC